MAQTAPLATFEYYRTRLSPERQAKIIHLLFVEELSIEVVANRFNVSGMTVRRVRMAHINKIDKRQRDAGKQQQL